MRKGRLLRILAIGVLAVAAVSPAGATTLIRMGLDDLVKANGTAVVGRVVDVSSYWNSDASLILTDVRVAADRVLKGEVAGKEITITLMGGTVGDLTTLIVAGADLAIGGEYVLFLNREDLPGAPGVLTVRDHCQGVFEVERAASGARALSQARKHPLLTDDRGMAEPPGGLEGLELAHIVREVQRLARTR